MLRTGNEPSPEHGELLAQARRSEDRRHRPTQDHHFRQRRTKTRSGKIMRRLLRDVAEGRQLGDTTTLADPSVVEEINAKKSASTED